MNILHGLEAAAATALGSTPAVISMINTRKLQKEQAKRRETYEHILAHIDHWRNQQKRNARHLRRPRLHNSDEPNEPTWENKLAAKVQMWASVEVGSLFETFRADPCGLAADQLTRQVLAEKDNSRFLAIQIRSAVFRSTALIIVAVLAAYVSFYVLTSHRSQEYQTPWNIKHNVIAAVPGRASRIDSPAGKYAVPSEAKESHVEFHRPPISPPIAIGKPSTLISSPASAATLANPCSSCSGAEAVASSSLPPHQTQQAVGGILSLPGKLISSAAQLLELSAPSADGSTPNPTPSPTP